MFSSSSASPPTPLAHLFFAPCLKVARSIARSRSIFSLSICAASGSSLSRSSNAISGFSFAARFRASFLNVLDLILATRLALASARKRSSRWYRSSARRALISSSVISRASIWRSSCFVSSSSVRLALFKSAWTADSISFWGLNPARISLADLTPPRSLAWRGKDKCSASLTRFIKVDHF